MLPSVGFMDNLKKLFRTERVATPERRFLHRSFSNFHTLLCLLFSNQNWQALVINRKWKEEKYGMDFTAENIERKISIGQGTSPTNQKINFRSVPLHSCRSGWFRLETCQIPIPHPPIGNDRDRLLGPNPLIWALIAIHRPPQERV